MNDNVVMTMPKGKKQGKDEYTNFLSHFNVYRRY